MSQVILYFFLILFPSIVISQTTHRDTTKHIDIKSAKVRYAFTNGWQKGERIVIFDDFGRKLKEITIIKPDTEFIHESGINDTLESKAKNYNSWTKLMQKSLQQSDTILKICTDKEIITIKYSQKIGYRKPGGVFLFMPSLPDSLVKEYSIGQDTILGKTCQIYPYMGVLKLWLWKGIPLRKEALNGNTADRMQENAIEIDENYPIQPYEFDIPKGVTIK